MSRAKRGMEMIGLNLKYLENKGYGQNKLYQAGIEAQQNQKTGEKNPFRVARLQQGGVSGVKNSLCGSDYGVSLTENCPSDYDYGVTATKGGASGQKGNAKPEPGG